MNLLRTIRIRDQQVEESRVAQVVVMVMKTARRRPHQKYSVVISGKADLFRRHQGCRRRCCCVGGSYETAWMIQELQAEEGKEQEQEEEAKEMKGV